MHDHRDAKGERILVVQLSAERYGMDGHLVIELEDGVSYEEHQETMSRSKERCAHIRAPFEQTLSILTQPGFLHGQRRFFRRSYERMTLVELAQTAILWAPQSDVKE